MSSYITLNLPLIDMECIQKAVEKCGLTLNKEIDKIILSNGIILTRSFLGYNVIIQRSQMSLIQKLQRFYESEYNIKMKKLIDSRNAINKLTADIERSNEKLKKLRSRLAVEKEEDIETNEKLIKIESNLKILDGEKEKSLIENKKIEEEFKEEIENTENIRKNMVDTIKTRAEKQNYKVKYSKLKNGKIQLVLYR